VVEEYLLQNVIDSRMYESVAKESVLESVLEGLREGLQEDLLEDLRRVYGEFTEGLRRIFGNFVVLSGSSVSL
jgi:hypothetical protein